MPHQRLDFLCKHDIIFNLNNKKYQSVLHINWESLVAMIKQDRPYTNLSWSIVHILTRGDIMHYPGGAIEEHCAICASCMNVTDMKIMLTSCLMPYNNMRPLGWLTCKKSYIDSVDQLNPLSKRYSKGVHHLLYRRIENHRSLSKPNHSS